MPRFSPATQVRSAAVTPERPSGSTCPAETSRARSSSSSDDIEGQPRLDRRGTGVLLVQGEQACQLLDRLRMVVDAQVERHVGRPAEARVRRRDAQRRRLPPAAIATREVARAQRVEQAVCERTLALLEALPHRVDHRRPGQQVALRGVPAARAPTGPGQAGRARVARRAAARVDDAGLSLVPAGIGRDQLIEALAGARARVDQREPVRAEGHVRQGLGRDRSDPGLGEGHDGADRERAGGHGDAPRLGGDVAADDGERHSGRVEAASRAQSSMGPGATPSQITTAVAVAAVSVAKIVPGAERTGTGAPAARVYSASVKRR